MTRAEIERLIDEKVAARMLPLVDKLEAVIGKEQFEELRSLMATLEKVVALKGAQSEEERRLISELHQLTAAAHENLGGKKS